MPVPDSPVVGDFSRVTDLMSAVARQYPNHEALVHPAGTLTFGGWWEQAGKAARLLADAGVKAGDVVLMLMPTSIDYAVTTVAALRLGAVPTGLNTRLGPGEVSAIVSHAAPAVLVVDADVANRVLVTPPEVPVLSREDLRAAIDDAAAAVDAGPPLPQVSPDDPAVIVWTSGTTGLPKGAWFSHRKLQGVAAMAGDMARPFDRRLSSTPFVHAGFMTRLWEQFAYVLTLTLTPEPWDAATVLDLLQTARITVASGVPTQWVKLLRLSRLERIDTPALRLAITATAPAAPELIEEINRRFGVPVVVRYASTESPTGTGTRIADPPEIAFRTVGRPQPGVELSIIDDAGNVVPRNSVGRIRLRHDACMNGYWRDPVGTAQTITPDGWLITGDLGRVDGDGNLVLVGRASDMYIRGGYNVYPLEVENVLSAHPAVDQIAVFGAPAPVIGEIGVAVVVPADPGQPPSLEALREWANQRLADYKAPDELRIVRDLPRNATGKVDRRALRATTG